jgi:hypothetical protein
MILSAAALYPIPNPGRSAFAGQLSLLAFWGVNVNIKNIDIAHTTG